MVNNKSCYNWPEKWCQEDKLWEAFGIGVDPKNRFVEVRNIKRTNKDCYPSHLLYILRDLGNHYNKNVRSRSHKSNAVN